MPLVEVSGRPQFDVIVDGRLRFSQERIGPNENMLDLITSLKIKRSIDKAQTRGRQRVARTNQALIRMHNPGGQLNNFLRMGRHFRVSLGYQGGPLITVGRYRLYHPKWTDDAKKPDELTLMGYGPELQLHEDKVPRTYRRKTHSDIAIQIARERGWKWSVTPTAAKITESKGPQESMLDLIERLAFDLGWDFYVDETMRPPVLHFEPPDAGEGLVYEGRRLTIGEGPESGASLIASRLSTEIRYPTTFAASSQRGKNGKTRTVQGSGANSLVVGDSKAKPAGIIVTDEKLGLVGGTSTASQQRKRLGRIADQATTKYQFSATFPFGVPFFRLRQRVPVVGKGDRNGLYSIVGIEHDPLGKSGWTTMIKGQIGGGRLKKAGGRKEGAGATNLSIGGKSGKVEGFVQVQGK